MKRFYLQTVNPTLTPGHPDQRRGKSPAETILPPPSKAAPRPMGQSWTERLSELPISKNSCWNSPETSEDDFITAFAPHHPPQHQPQHSLPTTSITPAEGPGCHHQLNISPWLSSLQPCVWCCTCIVSWISTNKTRKFLPGFLERSKWPHKPGEFPWTMAKVNHYTVISTDPRW